MEPFFEDYLERMQELHQEIQKAIEDLPRAALNWPPGREMNSIAVLVVHLTGAERYWIGDVVGGDPSGRVRESEFQVKGLETGDLKARLDGSLAYTRQLCERLTLQALSEMRASPRDGREFSVAWSLLHALEHTALHLGHIQVTRQLWRQRQIASV